MRDIKDITACVIDRGTFFPVAQRLAREYKKVYYHKPNGESFETVAENCRGDGHENIEYVEDFWRIKSEIDVFVFPDCRDGGLQIELESQGFPVWGGRLAIDLENHRDKWHKLCPEIGLPLPNTTEVYGLENLAVFLHEHEGERLFVKISRFRGDMETWEAKTAVQVANKLDYLRQRFGPLANAITFFVQEAVETDIESGGDTYNIRGKYPNKVILGYEKKGESYFAVVKDRKDMPEEVWSCFEALAPILAENRYANFVSSEIRIKDGESFWLDPCLRTPSPAGEEELEMYWNFGDIVYQGAQGILEEPQFEAQFCGEAVITYCGDRDAWKSIEVPEEIEQWVKLYASAYHDGAYHFPPSQDPEAIGCVVGLGNNPHEVLEHLKEIEEALKEQPVELHIEPLAALFEEIEKAEEEGIEFTEKEMPEPVDAL